MKLDDKIFNKYIFNEKNKYLKKKDNLRNKYNIFFFL